MSLNKACLGITNRCVWRWQTTVFRDRKQECLDITNKNGLNLVPKGQIQKNKRESA